MQQVRSLWQSAPLPPQQVFEPAPWLVLQRVALPQHSFRRRQGARRERQRFAVASSGMGSVAANARRSDMRRVIGA